MSDARVIKRYANRKLYDTHHSRYVTLEQISEMVRNGDDVKIIDNKSKEDLTSVTLAQIIFEEEKKKRSFLSLQTMRRLIQDGGEQFSHLVNEAQRRVGKVIPKKKDGEAADDEESDIGQADTYGVSRKQPLVEFREWIDQTKHSLEERIGKIRHAVEDNIPTLHKDVREVTERLTELENKLKQHEQSGK